MPSFVMTMRFWRRNQMYLEHFFSVSFLIFSLGIVSLRDEPEEEPALSIGMAIGEKVGPE